MTLTFNQEIFMLLGLIRETLGKDQDLYLVGGAVRDAILGRPIHDLDFAMDGNPTALAKRVAGKLKAGFFILDDQRHTARVLYQTPEGKQSPLDFVQFTGGSLDQDLRLRDFTLNAMALSLRNLNQVIDPLNGQADLSAGLLRACTDQALLDDPVRVLRGIRLAMQFDLAFSDGLTSQMQTAAERLPETSYERQRDEFFKILEGPHPANGIRLSRQFGVFDSLIPPLTKQEHIPASPPHTLPLFDHTIAAVAFYQQLINHILAGKPLEGSPWWLSHAVSELGRFSSETAAYFSEELTLGRSKRGLALLGTLLHDLGKPLTMKLGEDGRLHYYGHARLGADQAWKAARRLALSNTEAGWVQTMVRQHMALLPLVNDNQPLTRQKIYQFFDLTGEVGVAIAFLSLADTLATFGERISEQGWRRAVRVTRGVLTAWWQRRSTAVSPALLLDGHDLQKEFGLDPGEQIGRLLSALREAQAVGKVSNLEEARAFIRSRLNSVD